MTTERIVIKGKTIFRLCLALALVSASALGYASEGCERGDRVCINAREAAAQASVGRGHENDATKYRRPNEQPTCAGNNEGCEMPIDHANMYKNLDNKGGKGDKDRCGPLTGQKPC
jgi:hypothetical protein